MPDNILLLFMKFLNGEASVSEEQELEQFRKMNPQLQVVFEELAGYWMDRKKNKLEDSYFERHLQRLNAADPPLLLSSKNIVVPISEVKINKKQIKVWKILLAASVFAVVLLLQFLFNKEQADEKTTSSFLAGETENVFKTGMGSQSRLTLPDGSEIWANANTKIYYDKNFGITNRNVILNGEAYFKVAKSKELPFCIETNKISITVTGTIFNVRSYDKESKAETSVFEGSVRVANKGLNKKTFVLKSSDKLIVQGSSSDRVINTIEGVGNAANGASQQEVLSLSKIIFDPIDSLVVETAWMKAKLAFSDESFEEIANKMENWYGVSIVFENQSLKKMRFTGRFTKETINEALDALQFTASFQYQEMNKLFTIY